MVVAGSVVMALSAQVAIAVGFSPVPITGQTFAVLLVGALLGARRGSAAVALYLLEGASGLPVFAGGAAGAVWLVGPTAGYLVGFLPAALIAGWVAERTWGRSVVATLAAMTVATCAIFACGLAWLSRFVEPGLLPEMGLYPFVVGALIKIALATVALPSGWRVISALASPR
jgi:biotin transport system substrate-specific component